MTVPVADMCIGEVREWHAGVCVIRAERADGRAIRGGLHDQPDRLTVYGDGGHPIARVPCEGDVPAIRAAVDRAIRREMDAL